MNTLILLVILACLPYSSVPIMEEKVTPEMIINKAEIVKSLTFIVWLLIAPVFAIESFKIILILIGAK